MSLDLYQYNQKAYESANQMMEKTKKAAVIHPTGTGKSFLAFKLAEEHPESKVLWLAPSEYIFQTQVKNLKKALGEDISESSRILANITFFTYSRLMMQEASICELTPDYIILDEFHRCGAAEWGKSVRKLLDAYPDAKLLGLSATNIRYLDGQRDMAEELFGGCIASEMTLGEAIAKEILPAPEYVVSMYAYEEAYKRLKKQVHGIKNPALQKENEKLLEELRRALEQADGLDVVFQKHMPSIAEQEHGAKYIVFCSDKAHMEEMAEKAGEWFSLVDKKPHVYTVVYDNPEAGKEFAAFQADHSSHLKLLYCIDMLNEGIHVDDIDGVILLRPTVSPTVYLQQVGRGLSAAKGKDGSHSLTGNGDKGGDEALDRGKSPIIFDIVNNFDSLYSICSLEQEIGEAFAAFPSTVKEREGFYERFCIFDEVKDCRELFGRLNRNLSAAWELYYIEAKRYYEAHGNLCMPNSYVTEAGLTVGTWLQTQRRVRKGKIPGKLTPEQIVKLDAIGMEWESGPERKWNRAYEKLAAYKEQFGNVDVKALYVTEDGFALGKWVSNMRSKWSRGEVEGKQENSAERKGLCLTEEQVQKLNALGMIWDKNGERWQRTYQEAVRFYRKNGNLNVPNDYITTDGLKLGIWISNQKGAYEGTKKGAAQLSAGQVEQLRAIGVPLGVR